MKTFPLRGPATSGMFRGRRAFCANRHGESIVRNGMVIGPAMVAAGVGTYYGMGGVFHGAHPATLIESTIIGSSLSGIFARAGITVRNQYVNHDHIGRNPYKDNIKQMSIFRK